MFMYYPKYMNRAFNNNNYMKQLCQVAIKNDIKNNSG